MYGAAFAAVLVVWHRCSPPMLPHRGMPCFFIFPWLYSIWGECAWFQYSRFRQNCKYFFGAAAVPPIRIKTASLQNKFTSLQKPPLHLRQPHSDSDKPAPPPSMSGSVTLLLQFFPLYYYEIMKHHIMMRRDATFHGRASLPADVPLTTLQILLWLSSIRLSSFGDLFRRL